MDAVERCPLVLPAYPDRVGQLAAGQCPVVICPALQAPPSPIPPSSLGPALARLCTPC